jgi:hypothetical protein
MALLNKIFPTEIKYKVTTTHAGNVIAETVVNSIEKAQALLTKNLTEKEHKQLEEKGAIPIQEKTNIVTIEKFQQTVPPKNLYEARLRHNDPELEDYHNENKGARQHREIEKEQKAGNPYYVGWSCQSLEWYGDDDPSTKKGRYKPKGEGGKITDINIPSYQQAQRLEREIDEKYNRGELDPHLDGKFGEDHYIIQYHGTYIKSMSDMDEYDKIHLKYDHPNDWSQIGKA